MEETLELESLKVDPSIEANQKARLAELRQQRDSGKVTEMLSLIESGAKGSENLMPLFVEAVENYATLGEICGVLRNVWGEYQPPAWA